MGKVFEELKHTYFFKCKGRGGIIEDLNLKEVGLLKIYACIFCLFINQFTVDFMKQILLFKFIPHLTFFFIPLAADFRCRFPRRNHKYINCSTTD